MKFAVVGLIILLLAVGVGFQYLGNRAGRAQHSCPTCGDETCSGEHPPGEQPEPVSDEMLKKIDEEKLTTTPSGLRYLDIERGTGSKPEQGDIVAVHYTGWLTDGTKFDSSLDRDAPFEFTVGMSEVIPGWDEGVGSMRVGGKRKLVVPPDLGYGEDGSRTIPPNATLIFDVELLDVKGAG